jgi:hypothetical protein
VFDQAYADRVASYYGSAKEDLSLEAIASNVPPPSAY